MWLRKRIHKIVFAVFMWDFEDTDHSGRQSNYGRSLSRQLSFDLSHLTGFKMSSYQLFRGRQTGLTFSSLMEFSRMKSTESIWGLCALLVCVCGGGGETRRLSWIDLCTLIVIGKTSTVLRCIRWNKIFIPVCKSLQECPTPRIPHTGV